MSSTNPESLPPLASYQVLSFDILGTLIDCDSVIHQHLLPLTRDLPPTDPLCALYPLQPTVGKDIAPRHPLVSAFDAHEYRLTSKHPGMAFEDVLRQSYLGLANDLAVSGGKQREQEANALAASIGSWPAFPDTVAALHTLHKRYKLVPLSNISRTGINAILNGPLAEVKFDSVYIAEDIGSYKPSRRNFDYLLGGVQKEFECKKEKLLHVAHGATIDHVPCEEMGIDHVWVRRGVDNWESVNPEHMKKLRVVNDLQALADQVEKEEKAAHGY